MAQKREVYRAIARAGYAAKGLIYGLIGLIAANAAWVGGNATGKSGLIHRIAAEPFGQVMLLALSGGVFAYAAWRVIGATADPDNRYDGAWGWVKRVARFISSFGYIGLGILAGMVAIGSGGGGDDTKKTLTAKLLAQPFGAWLVGIVGVVFVGVAIFQFYRAYKAPFMDDYSGEMSGTQRTWARRLGRFGTGARAVIFGIIAWFFFRAAYYTNPDEAAGLDRALAEVASQPYGDYLLATVAFGFVAYAVHCLASARYRRFASG